MTNDRNFLENYERLSCRVPNKGRTENLLKLHQVRDTFIMILAKAKDVEIQQYTQGYTMHMFGARLFLDYSTNTVYI